jgi:hypothetical protein
MSTSDRPASMLVKDGDGRRDLYGIPMEPTEPSQGTREPTFKFLFGIGTAIFLFGALFSQTKGADRTPDLIIFLTAEALLIAALLVGQMRRRVSQAAPEWRSGPVSTTVLVVELILSFSFIKDLVIYELHGH